MALDLPSRNNGGSGDALPPHHSPFALLAHVLYDCNGVFPDPLPYEWHHLQALGSPGRDEENFTFTSQRLGLFLVCICFLCREVFVFTFLREFLCVNSPLPSLRAIIILFSAMQFYDQALLIFSNLALCVLLKTSLCPWCCGA